MTAESSDQPSPEPGLVPLARPGARWTPEEQEILVTEVREGKDMTAIMDHHGRNRTGIEERLVMMVPDEAQVPDDEKLGWIFSRRAWRTASAPRPHRVRAVDGLPGDHDPGFRREHGGEALAHHGLVVGDQAADDPAVGGAAVAGQAGPPRGSTADTTNPPPGVGPADS